MAEYFSRVSQFNGVLKRIIEKLYPELGYNFLMKLIRKKDVSINGKRVTENAEVKKGDEVYIFLRASAVPLRIVFENEHIIAVYKPKGVTSDGDYSFGSLVAYCKQGAVLVHRLDTNTDGLLLFAKTPTAEAVLLDAMKNGEIEKTYKAIVYGEVWYNHQIITAYLQKNSEKGRVKLFDHRVDNSEKVSLSATTISVKNGCSELSVTICGGKTHQIRAQLAFVGYFILGDGKYGDDRINRLYGKKSQELTATEISFCISKDILGLNSVHITL